MDAKEALSKFLFLVVVIFFGLAIWLSLYFVQTRPRTANVTTGSIHEMAYHGTFVYLTDGEYWLRVGCFVVAGCSAVAAVLVADRIAKKESRP